jgi:hypothetical protein
VEALVPVSKKELQNDSKAGKDKGGGGGGLSARARRYEITGQKTKFIPADMNKQLILAACFGFFQDGF